MGYFDYAQIIFVNPTKITKKIKVKSKTKLKIKTSRTMMIEMIR